MSVITRWHGICGSLTADVRTSLATWGSKLPFAPDLLLLLSVAAVIWVFLSRDACFLAEWPANAGGLEDMPARWA